MTIWILVILSIQSKNLYVNSFDSKTKCEERLKKMASIYELSCVKTTLNK